MVEYSPGMSITTNYSQISINQEWSELIHLFAHTNWQTKPDQGWYSQEHEVTYAVQAKPQSIHS